MLGELMTWEERVDAARQISVIEVVRRLDLGKPKKCGRESKMVCPLHGERSASFFISPDKSLWNCFGCGKGGDAIGLWMNVRRTSFKQAVREMVP